MTIFATATAAGRAGIAVVRVSGPEAGAAIEVLCGNLPPPRLAVLRRFCDPASGRPLDHGLVLWFPAPASFTGEDVAELHLHGGRAVTMAVLDGLAKLPGLRPAEAGEFTRRAFDNGKLDLTAVEGLADLVAAETEAQRRQAVRQLDGALGRLYDGWRVALVRALAEAEAKIDFPEEGLPEDLVSRVRPKIEDVYKCITQHLDDNGRGERLREGVFVAIVGAPNVGKSSLLNRLARRDAAIVSRTAGTTRDVIEVEMDIGGYPATLADTAGLRETGGEIEREGVRRAIARAESADLKIAVVDATQWPGIDPRTSALIDDDTMVAINKIDLCALPEDREVAGRPAWLLSCETGAGFDDFVVSLGSEIAERLRPGDAPALTRTRHRTALAECAAALESFLQASAPEFAAEDLRLATRALGRITGRVDVEDLLDAIFAEFCIGK